MRALSGLYIAFFLLSLAFCAQRAKNSFTDDEGNIFLLHDGVRHRTLLYLSCTGGKDADLDTAMLVFDSLGWNIAVCAKSRNHRDPRLNEQDILNLVDELLTYPQVDSYGIVLYGFSGQGAQALMTAMNFPQKFAGVIVQCAHHGLMNNPDWQNAQGLPIILVSRETDWNRPSNERMAALFSEKGVKVQLLITPGEHRIGNAEELLSECRMLKEMMD